jgi:peptidyl-dipeptidase Dcp
MKIKTLLIPTMFLLLIFPHHSTAQNSDNTFFEEWDTPFQTPPFKDIKTEHYLPALEEGIRQHNAEVEVIINNTEIPTFKNTIEALEKSGKLLTKVYYTFYNLNDANTNDEMQEIAKKIAPMLAKHNDDINLNEKLFEKVKTIYEKRDDLGLTPEQKTVLKNHYDDFIRGGVNLNTKEKEEFRKINEELSILTVKFGENILKETNSIGLIIENKNDLAGLPESVIQAAFESGKDKGYEGKWVFTLQRSSFTPFLQYSEKRNLRKKILEAYINRGNNNNELDTKKILTRIAELRVKRANLLGYKTHADFILEKNMAKNPETVYKFLNELWLPALKRAEMEMHNLQNIINQEGNDFKLEAWDWWYYAEKVKKEKYDLDEEMLRPYFKLENVLQGVFDVASNLYGIQFVERNDIQTYHPDVKVYEVKEADGKHIGVFYTDYFPRDSKGSGAWEGEFRVQSNIHNDFITPVIVNVGNFTKPTTGKPSLLSLYEVSTLFHEFGHALHGLLSNCVYPSVSCTSVPRDFIELPSQIMENWALEPEVLKMYARHYQTNQIIPDDLISKIENSRIFNQGFSTVEYLAACYLDMDWHTLTTPEEMDVISFEKESFNKIGLVPEIESRYQSTNFLHIFSSWNYSAGYYSYIWAAVIDADAFEAFKEKGLFDQATAVSFRKNILEKGGSEDPMILYKNFRGREPKVDALLKRRGLD